MITKQVYEENDRVEYYVFRDGKKVHRLGYVKARRVTLFGVRYYVCVADHTREIDIVKHKQIFGISEYRGKSSNFQNNQNNGD